MSDHPTNTVIVERHARAARDIILALRDRLYDQPEPIRHPRAIATQELDYALDELAMAIGELREVDQPARATQSDARQDAADPITP